MTRLPFPALLFLGLLGLAGLVSLGAACAPTKSVASQGPAKVGDVAELEEAAPVAALPLGRGAIESVLRYSTNLEAETEVEVYSEATRLVTQLLVEEGDYVRKGQILLRLQDEEQKSALARVDSQLQKARREYERQKRLYDQELIAEQVYTDATYELEQLQLARGDAERELSYTVVRAPISGMLTARLVSLGDHVQSNQHLFSIVDFDSIVARIYVPEKELSRLAVGQQARLMAQAQGEQVRHGAIERIAPVVDSRSGTVKVTLSVPRGAGLRPGMYVEVELVAETDPNALLVPKRALVYDEDQVYVFRVTDSETVERTLIEPLIEQRDWVKVDGALHDGERVVVAGQAGLRDGAKVRLLSLEEALDVFSSEIAAAGGVPGTGLGAR